VLEWAAAEGWNPGVEDAAAFLSADESGFLLGTVDKMPISAISVVKYNPNDSFLGLYLCHPDYRGQGFGLAIWRAGLTSLGDRSIGLDGVVAQQQNYTRSGFHLAYRNIRYAGSISNTGYSDEYTEILAAQQADCVALDALVSGTTRNAYMRSWTAQTSSRITLGYYANNQLQAMGADLRKLYGVTTLELG